MRIWCVTKGADNIMEPLCDKYQYSKQQKTYTTNTNDKQIVNTHKSYITTTNTRTTTNYEKGAVVHEAPDQGLQARPGSFRERGFCKLSARLLLKFCGESRRFAEMPNPCENCAEMSTSWLVKFRATLVRTYDDRA